MSCTHRQMEIAAHEAFRQWQIEGEWFCLSDETIKLAFAHTRGAQRETFDPNTGEILESVRTDQSDHSPSAENDADEISASIHERPSNRDVSTDGKAWAPGASQGNPVPAQAKAEVEASDELPEPATHDGHSEGEAASVGLPTNQPETATKQRENILSQHEVRPGSTSPGIEQQCNTLGVTGGESAATNSRSAGTSPTRTRARDGGAPDETPSQIQDDGWIEWNGGEIPVACSAIIEFRTRGGAVDRVPAAWCDWEHWGADADADAYDSDIIAYRIVREA